MSAGASAFMDIPAINIMGVNHCGRTRVGRGWLAILLLRKKEGVSGYQASRSAKKAVLMFLERD
jgi:hypothetical protein